MADDLKERLRARIVVNSGAGPLHIADKTCHQAAARIEQLEAENERLRGLVEDFVIHITMGWELDGLVEAVKPLLKAKEQSNG